MRIQTLEITPEILQLIAELDEFKGAWRALRNIAPERLGALQKVATIESIGSSTRIEGVKLSNREVEALLSNLEIGSFRSRDEEEVAGYAEVMERVFESWETIPLTENYIKQLHALLLRHSSKDERHRGEYKTLPNHVEAFGPNGQSLGVVFQTASPFDTPHQMEELILWTREVLEDKSLHPLLVTTIFTVVFLAIHPFQDGNGRLSRILTTLLLLKSGYAYVPYSSLESVIEENKDGYYLALRRTQGTLESDKPDWHPWLLFFLRAMQKQKARLEAKIEREQILTAALPELSVQILELVKERGRIKTSDIEKLTGESRSTIKARLNDLVETGHLARHGQGRSTWYSLA
jgi:Fic family protein